MQVVPTLGALVGVLVVLLTSLGSVTMSIVAIPMLVLFMMLRLALGM